MRARPCPASTLRSPPLELPPEAPHITSVSVVPTPREHPGCSQVLWRAQRRRYAMLYDRLQRLAGVLSHRHSLAPPACTAALMPARVLPGARCSSNIMRKMSPEIFGAVTWSTRSRSTWPPRAPHAVQRRSGAGAAAGGPPQGRPATNHPLLAQPSYRLKGKDHYIRKTPRTPLHNTIHGSN